MQTTLPSRDLVLIGAGHTNMHVVKMWRMKPIADVQLTLVSPFSRATYSGMLPGTLAGLYAPEEMEIDLHRFAVSCGVRLIVAEAIGFDPQRRRVEFADRPEIRYDVAAIGIGSVPIMREVWECKPNVLSIKPMATFRRRLDERLVELDASKGKPRICVVGAGAGGVEVTFALASLLRRRQHETALTLLDSGDNILKGYLPKTVKRARDEFARHNVDVLCERKVESIHDGEIRFHDSDPLAADLVIWAASAAPPPTLENFHLPKAEDGFLAIRNTLQTTADFPVFVVGDTGTMVDQPVRKAGVYAVREGPVLWKNLRRILRDEPLVEYKPQSGFLSLLSTGDGKAIGEYKGRTVYGGWVWKWKDYIDRKFMRMYQDYRAMDPAQMNVQPKPKKNEPPPMRCRGCGGKVGANVLSAALDRLQITSGEFVVQGLNQPDDAAVLDPKAGAVEVVSVDFFQAFLDDPYLVGRVAALNSLSDLWAMGARPTGAMAVMTLPGGPPRQQAEILFQLLAGGVREIQSAGAVLLGGHTTESDALTMGFTVFGALDGKPPLTKAGLKPGDRLVLAKPLGTGVLLAAHGQCRCPAKYMDGLIENMLSSNARAGEIARQAAVAAVTDITGFGLAGHLLEMLDASGVQAKISLSRLPLLPGFCELAGEGILSSLDPANRETEDRIAAPSDLKRRNEYHALFDPQTSGGLIMGVAADQTESVVAKLREAGYDRAAVIGEVVEDESKSIIIDE